MQSFILDTREQLEAFWEFVSSNENDIDVVSFDLETDSVVEIKANIYGIGIAFQEEEGFYIPVRAKDGSYFFDEHTAQSSIGRVTKLLKSKKVVGHNVIYDSLVWYHSTGERIYDNIHADTILMKHMIDEEPPFGLKEVAVKYLGPWADKAQEALYANIKANGGTTTKTNLQMFKADTNILGEYACFLPKSSRITMSDGTSKFIEDVSVGDRVITHTGKSQRVYRAFKKQYKGKIYNLEVENGRSVYNATSEHPFLTLNQDTLKYEWKKVEDIKVNDLLVRGELEKSSTEELECEEFWWLLGFYQAEGHISNRNGKYLYTVFSIHQKEEASLLEVLRKLGYKGSVCRDKRGLGCQVTVCDTALAKKILSYTGGIFKCYEKRVNEEALRHLNSNPKAAINFIAGFMDGDGCIRQLKNRSSSFQYKVETTSPHLVSTLDILSASLKLNCSSQVRLKSYKGRRDRYAVTFFSSAAEEVSKYSRLGKNIKTDAHRESYKKFVRVKAISVSEYSGTVHNISVEVDNSYISNGLVSHNCHDVMLTYKLYTLFSKDLVEQGLDSLFYKEEVMPLYREVTIPMKEIGIGVDTGLLSSMLEQATHDESALEVEILNDISPLTLEFEAELLNEEFPVKRTGNFPKRYAATIGLELTSTAKKVIENLPVDTDEQVNFKQWMLGEVAELTGPIRDTQLKMLQDKHDRRTPFNLGSKAHLKWLFFDRLDLDPLSTTETGLPQVDDAFLDSVAKDYTWVSKLRDLNTILKMKSTYIQGILDRQVDGSLYTSFLQFGTTSGRFASRNPNLQNCPAPQNTGSVVDKYVNCVRDSIISRPGYKLIGADFSSLEPHIAAYVSGDPDLIDIFVTGKDFYSAIAVKQFNLTHLSAYKEDSNYLGKVDKATRDKTKTYSLAAFYGASAYRIADVLGCDVEEADELLEGYLSAFPGIRNFINRSHFDACNKGYVTTIFGRVRHLPEAKEIFQAYGHSILDSKWARSKGLSDTRKKFKNLLNNAVNFQIQGTAGHVMNRAMLLTKRLFADNNINGTVVMTIHDEQIIEVREDQAEIAAGLVRQAMETAVTLDPIKLKATPIIGNSYGECK